MINYLGNELSKNSASHNALIMQLHPNIQMQYCLWGRGVFMNIVYCLNLNDMQPDFFFFYLRSNSMKRLNAAKDREGVVICCKAMCLSRFQRGCIY